MNASFAYILMWPGWHYTLHLIKPTSLLISLVGDMCLLYFVARSKNIWIYLTIPALTAASVPIILPILSLQIGYMLALVFATKDYSATNWIIAMAIVLVLDMNLKLSTLKLLGKRLSFIRNHRVYVILSSMIKTLVLTIPLLPFEPLK